MCVPPFRGMINTLSITSDMLIIAVNDDNDSGKNLLHHRTNMQTGPKPVLNCLVILYGYTLFY